jgi:hypothetical protein
MPSIFGFTIVLLYSSFLSLTVVIRLEFLISGEAKNGLAALYCVIPACGVLKILG